MHREPITSAAMQPSLASSEWGAWSQDILEPAGDGPGLLVSPMFWLGSGTLLLWGCATWLALAFG